MSVRIEILDYKYVQGNILTWSNSSVDNWNEGTGINTNTTGVGIKIESTAGVSSQYSGFYSSNLSLINGNSYTLTFNCNSVFNNQQVNSKVFLRGAGSGLNSYRPIGNQSITAGTHSYTFTMDESLNNSEATMQVYFELTDGNLANKAIRISNVKLVNNSALDTIDWDNSVVGELDITDHSDFPLAMTFQISDFKDITSTSGDYSKTFKFPATKNNNNILKHLYIPNINNANNITERKPCRIISGGMYTQLGLIRITGVGGYGKVPSSYSGVFYGNNLTWAADLGDSYMNQLAWGTDGDNLEYNKTSIMATWQDVDCNSNPNSYIVYPITSYGQYNEEGESRTIQLLDTAWDYSGTGTSAKVGYFGYWDSGSSYETPLPSPDWRPAVFVKNTLDKLFGSVGYKISSAFMDTDTFKKLVWLLPNFKYNNPDDRFSLYSAEAKFDTSLPLATNTFGAATTWDGIDDTPIYETKSINTGTLNTEFSYSSTTEDTSITYIGGSDGFKIAEYGYYSLKASGFKAALSELLQDGTTPTPIYYYGFGTSPIARDSELDIERMKFQIQVQTVGQSSWKTIATIEDATQKNFVGSVSTDGAMSNNLIDSSTSYDWELAKVIEMNDLYLNKDDKVRLINTIKWHPRASSVVGIDDSGVWTFKSTPTVGTFDIQLDPNNVEYGQTYNLTDVMNPDYKQIDFIKGIAHAYNLQMTTDESTKTVYIEPFDSFYKPYKDAIDWTSKLSRADEITDKWIENDLKRSLVFKYKSDSADAKVKFRGETYFDDVEDEYPYRETLPDTFEKGDSTFENPFFAGTYNAKDTSTTGIPNVDTAYSACLWTGNHSPETSGRTNKGFDFLPRLLYWNKYSPVGQAGGVTDKFAVVQTWSSTTKIITADATTSPSGYLSVIYPQATMVNRDSTTSPNLAYGNVYVRDYDDATGVYTYYRAGKGLYETYYRNMVEMLKRSPRLRTVSIDLKVTDIINLDFRKLVYIDGVYWRINRVVDYMPNNNSTTKVELIEWFQIGVFAATAPSFGSSGNNSNWGVGGSYTVSTSAEAEPPSSF